MAILSKEVIDYLESEGIGTFEENIFIGSLPSHAKNSIMVKDTGGFKPKKDTTSDPTFQIYGRYKYYKNGMELFQEIKNFFHDKYNFWLGDYIYVYSSEAMQEPQHIGKDENGNELFSINFHMRVKYY